MMARPVPSTSLQSKDVEFEELNKEQRLKAAMYYGIKQIAREVEEEMEVTISSQVLATLSESLYRQAEVYAVDLELFAKHCRRINISVEDVKLLARRNSVLLKHLENVAAQQKAEKEATKRPRKTSNQAKAKSGTKKRTKDGGQGQEEEVDDMEDG